MCWVYKWDGASSRYQVGYYNSGTFVAIESHTNRSDAANSVNYLNGGPYSPNVTVSGSNLTGGT